MSNSKLSPLHLRKQVTSPRYFGFWPGMQDSTDGRTQVLETGGTGRHLLLGTNGLYSQVTANSGYASIVGTANGQDKSLATADVLPWDLFSGQSLILQATVNAAAPGATAFIFNARGAAGDVKGAALSVDTAGKPVIFIRDTGTTFATNVPTNVVCDSTDHVVTAVINGTAKTAQIFDNGVAVSTLTTPQAITATAGSTQGNDPARWGGSGDFVSAAVPTWVNSATLKIRHMHVIVMDSFPANLATLIAELVRNPHRPLSAKLLP